MSKAKLHIFHTHWSFSVEFRMNYCVVATACVNGDWLVMLLLVSHYQNYCVEHNQILHNDKGHWVLWAVQIHTEQIHDGGQPPS